MELTSNAPEGVGLGRDKYLQLDRRIRRTEGALPFAVDIDHGVLDRGYFGVRVEFAELVIADTRKVLEERIALWDETRVFGGFIFDFVEQEATGNLGSIALAEPNVLQIWITDFFEGDLSALEMVVNLTFDLHEHLQPIRRLAID